MTRVLQLTVLSVWREILSWTGAWWFAATLVGNEAIGPLIGLFVWSEVFPGDPRVAAYYVALLAVQMLTASYENHTFSERIYDGTISHELLAPKAVVIGPIGANIAIRAWLLLIGLPVLLVTVVAMDVSYDWTHLLVAVPALVLAGILRFLFTWTLALAAFWTQRVHAVVGFGSMLIFLLGGSAAPVVFLPEQIRPYAEALPFRAMLGFPGELATGSVSTLGAVQGFAWQLGWTGVFAVLALVVWRMGVHRYTAVGG